MMAEERRKPGRPRVRDGDETVSVHLKLPARVYDRLFTEYGAQRLRSIQELIRIKIAPSDSDDDDE